MNTTPPELMDLARRLLAVEATSSPDASFAVCRRLRDPLAKLAGAEGFRALLSRALSLASSLDPLLTTLRVDPSGSLEKVAPYPNDGPDWAEAEAQLVAQVLSLLATFIGHALTLHLVQNVWPSLKDGMPGGNIS